IESLPSVYDEPFADASQIPTFLVSRMARESVTVALSGDGGDELFGGYNRYLWAERLWNKAKLLPSGLRRVLARPLTGRAESWWDDRYAGVERFLPASMRVTEAGVKLHKTEMLMGARNRAEFYGGILCQWRNASELVPGAQPVDDLARGGERGFGSFTEFMMCADLGHYLPNTILTKLDRASMAVGLEARVPLLDHRVVEFAWRLPMSMKIADGSGKRILRRVLDRYVPGEVFDRPKQGFNVPLGDWLRGPMRDWAEDLLSESRLGGDGYFDARVVRDTWKRFLAGGSMQYPIWNVLMFQQWAAAYASPARGKLPIAA
ncbi:MAG: asparagine synthase C-terminal domain-containing protein, partial [Verrucomicrobiales bacterium]|nr:asparagine synthase C-terminal domain-containing protein [Verrucomicrobiales bacterium]